MDSLRSVGLVPGGIPVGDRQAGGNKRQADAFRRALQEQAPARQEAPMRPGLQPSGQDGRKNDGIARYVDVIA
jgi:hypothetical protein